MQTNNPTFGHSGETVQQRATVAARSVTTLATRLGALPELLLSLLALVGLALVGLALAVRRPA